MMWVRLPLTTSILNKYCLAILLQNNFIYYVTRQSFIKNAQKCYCLLFLVSCRFFLCGESPFAAGRPVEIVNVPREPYWLWYGSPGGTRHRNFYKMKFTLQGSVRCFFYIRRARKMQVSLKDTINGRNKWFRLWPEDLTAPERMQDPGAVGWWSFDSANMNGYQPLRILPGPFNKAKHLNAKQRQFRQIGLFFKNKINYV